MKQYDVIIIGGGPAGSMLARLTRGKTVAIIDRRPLDREYAPGDTMKSCGGLLAPDAQKFLRHNNIEIPQHIFDCDQYDHVSTTDLDINLTRRYRRDYKNMDREAFDRALLNGIAADKYFDTTVQKIEKRDGMFIVNDTWAAPILVGADGSTSIVRRKLFPSIKFREYVSIQETFDKKLVDEYKCYFDRDASDYYGWAMNKCGHTYFGYLIPAAPNAVEKFTAIKKRLGFGDAKTREGTTLIRPRAFHPVICDKNLFLIGEAGGYISPSSAEGISFAFRTAKILADTDFDVKKFKFKMKKIQIIIFTKSLKSIFINTPFMRHIVMRLSFLR